MVNLVALTLDIEDQRACLALNVTNQIVVVGKLELWLEYDLDGYLRAWGYNSGHGADSERITVLGAALYTLLGEVEAEGDLLLVDHVHNLAVLTIEEKGSKLNLARLEEHVWLDDAAHNHKVLHNLLCGYLEQPE